MDRKLAVSYNMRHRELDNNYTLFESGKILHEYDKSRYPGGQDHSEELTVNQVSEEIKMSLLEAAAEEDKALVRKTLSIS